MRGKFNNLTGQRFGRLTACCPVAKNNHGRVLWLCDCECGLDAIVPSDVLLKGASRSCGCLNCDTLMFRPNRTTHGGNGTRLYRIWKGMKNRCSNPNSDDFKYWGGRGITICPEWQSDFQAFHDWAMSNGYTDELSIDRIDNDKGYFPDNCRWTTAKEQARNRRSVKNAKTITYDGETHTLSEWAEITGINRTVLHGRYFRRGWSAEKTLTTPLQRKGGG